MIARKSLLIVTSQFFMRFIGWIALIILAKLWGNVAPEVLGTIGFAMAFVSLFTFVSDFGFSQAHVKRVSEGNNIGICIGTYMSVKLVLTLLMAIVIGLFLFVGNIFGITFYDATSTTVVLLFVYYFIFITLAQISISTFQATKEIVKRQLIVITENIVKVPLFIVVVLLGSNIVYYKVMPEGPIEFLAMTYVAGAFAMACIGFYFLRTYPIKRPTKEMFKSYVTFALPVMLLSVITVLSINIDKLMIGYFWTSVEVGYYFTVQQILQIVLIFPTAIGLVLFPTISGYYAKNKMQNIKDTIHLAIRYISMVMLPIVILVIIFAKPIISIMLTDIFLPATTILVILAMLAFVTAMGVSLSSLIVGINKPKQLAKIGIVMCTVNLILNVSFIPSNGLLTPYGINGALGAAVATLISGIIGFVGLCYVAKKLTGIKILHKYVFYHIISGSVMGFFFFMARHNMVVVGCIELIVYVLFGLLIYFGWLIMFKEFTKEDFEFFKDLIHPKAMLRYIGGEFKK